MVAMTSKEYEKFRTRLLTKSAKENIGFQIDTLNAKATVRDDELRIKDDI